MGGKPNNVNIVINGQLELFTKEISSLVEPWLNLISYMFHNIGFYENISTKIFLAVHIVMGIHGITVATAMTATTVDIQIKLIRNPIIKPPKCINTLDPGIYDIVIIKES